MPQIIKIGIFLSTLLLASCVSIDTGGYVVPGEILDERGKYYIIFSEDDQQALHELLREGMVAKGLFVESGFEDRMPEGVTYRVEYGGQWQWDVTWYLLNFNVRIYDPESKLLIASAHSLRTSLGRKKPEDMIAESLDKIFID